MPSRSAPRRWQPQADSSLVGPYNDLVTKSDSLGITDEELDAIANVSLERMNNLAHVAGTGGDPGPLTADEQVLFDGMKREIAANPDVAYHPMDLG